MGAREAAGVRKMQKVCGVQRGRGAGKERMGLKTGGGGEKRWIVGGGTERKTRLGVVVCAVGAGEGRVGVVREGEEDRKDRVLVEREKRFWGGYRQVRSGL